MSYICDEYIYDIVLPWASPAVSSAHGVPQAVEEQVAKATTRGNNNGSGSDGRDTRSDKGPGSFLSEYTRGAHANHYPASLRTFASLFSFIFQLAAGKCKERRGPKTGVLLFKSTCAIRQRHRGQAKLEGAMLRATRPALSMVARSPGCAVAQKISGYR